jgi:transglutaminase-like putative cysteine protease
MLAAPRPSHIERFFQFSLLGMLACGFLALAGSEQLDWITQAALLAAFAVRAAKVSGALRFEWTVRTIALWMLAAVCFYPIDIFYISHSWPIAGLHLAAMLIALKVITARSNRDYTYLKLIAVVELVAAAMLAVDLEFFFFLALFLLFTVALLASGEVRQSAGLPETVARAGLRGFGRRLTVTSFVLCAAILTMTAGMFFVLPRAARGALNRIAPEGWSLPGFAENVSLGAIGRIQQSSRVVLHARTDQGESLEGVRWRGGALTHYDASTSTWTNLHVTYDPLKVANGLLIVGKAIQIRPGREIGYQVRLDEITSETLFFAGIPETIKINAGPLFRSTGGTFHVQNAPSDLVYRAYAFIEYENARPLLPPSQLSRSDRDDATQLPSPLDRRIPELAHAMAGDATSDEAKARAIESHLRHDYGYTLDLPAKLTSDPLADFLFVRKKGHCEYFASAMAVMLRTVGIPSRVVTGFQSGVFNPLTGWQVVRASDAHAWVEAWLEDSGWTVFDPTPASVEPVSQGPLARLALLYDAANQFWQDWILRYDLPHQTVLANRLHQMRFDPIPEPGARWEQDVSLLRHLLAFLMIVAAIAIPLTFFGPDLQRWWRNRRRVNRVRRGEGQASDATLLYQRMLATLARRGFQKPAWLTPSEFARVLPPSEMAVLVEDLTTAYNQLRFGGRGEAAPRLIRMLDRLESLER